MHHDSGDTLEFVIDQHPTDPVDYLKEYRPKSRNKQERIHDLHYNCVKLFREGYFTEDELDCAIANRDFDLLIAAINSGKMNESQINKISEIPELQYLITKYHKFTKDEVNQLLEDGDAKDRANIITNDNTEFTEEQVDKLLQYPLDKQLRCNIAKNKNIALTEPQINSLLNDGDRNVRLAVVENRLLTKSQIDARLQIEKDDNIRLRIIKKNELDYQQLNQILKDTRDQSARSDIKDHIRNEAQERYYQTMRNRMLKERDKRTVEKVKRDTKKSKPHRVLFFMFGLIAVIGIVFLIWFLMGRLPTLAVMLIESIAIEPEFLSFFAIAIPFAILALALKGMG